MHGFRIVILALLRAMADRLPLSLVCNLSVDNVHFCVCLLAFSLTFYEYCCRVFLDRFIVLYCYQ